MTFGHTLVCNVRKSLQMQNDLKGNVSIFWCRDQSPKSPGSGSEPMVWGQGSIGRPHQRIKDINHTRMQKWLYAYCLLSCLLMLTWMHTKLLSPQQVYMHACSSSYIYLVHTVHVWRPGAERENAGLNPTGHFIGGLLEPIEQIFCANEIDVLLATFAPWVDEKSTTRNWCLF
jgi:hypothetical protein